MCYRRILRRLSARVRLGSKGDWRLNLAISWIAQFLCIAGFSASFPFLPFYIRELGVTEVHAVELWSGVIVAGGSITMALVSPIWGVLADRRGRKLMVERSTFGGAIVLTAMAFAGNVQQLFFMRLVQGVLTGTVPAFMTMTATFAPPERVGFALGLMQMAAFTGSSVGPLIGGLVADHFGYRWAYAVTGLLLLMGGILVHFLVVEKFERPKGTSTHDGIGDSARVIVRSLPVLGAIIALGGLYMGTNTTPPILPLFVESLQEDSTLVNTATGSVYGVRAVASAVAAVFVGRLADRTGYRGLMLFCSLGAALAFVAQGFSPGMGVLLITSFAAGFFSGGIVPAANAFLARAVPRERQGAVFGLSNSVNSAGAAIGPLLGAAVATSWGLASGFIATGVLFGLVSVWILFMVKPEEETAPTQVPSEEAP